MGDYEDWVPEDEYEDEYDYYRPEPINSFCEDCKVWYTDYWCEACGYHGHECSVSVYDTENDYYDWEPTND